MANELMLSSSYRQVGQHIRQGVRLEFPTASQGDAFMAFTATGWLVHPVPFPTNLAVNRLASPVPLPGGRDLKVKGRIGKDRDLVKATVRELIVFPLRKS
jgi:hypothetical protein